MTCEHEFDFVGEQKAGANSNRYFKCKHCGTVKVRSPDGSQYLIPADDAPSDA